MGKVLFLYVHVTLLIASGYLTVNYQYIQYMCMYSKLFELHVPFSIFIFTVFQKEGYILFQVKLTLKLSFCRMCFLV